jgi:hypothetical protein
MIETISLNTIRTIKPNPSYADQKKKLEAAIKKSIHKLIDVEFSRRNEFEEPDFWNVKWEITQRIHQLSNEILLTHNII